MEIIKSWQLWLATVFASFTSYQAFELLKVHDADAGAGLFFVTVLLMSSVSFLLFNKVKPRVLITYMQLVSAISATMALFIYFDQGSVSGREKVPYFAFLTLGVVAPCIMLLVIWRLKKVALSSRKSSGLNKKLLIGYFAATSIITLGLVFVAPTIFKANAVKSVQQLEGNIADQVNSALAAQAQKFEGPLQTFVDQAAAMIGQNDLAWQQAATQLHNDISCYQCELWVGRTDFAYGVADYLPWRAQQTNLLSSTYQIGNNEAPPYAVVDRFFVQDVAPLMRRAIQGEWATNEAQGGNYAVIANTFVDNRNNVQWAVYLSTSVSSLIQTAQNGINLHLLGAKEYLEDQGKILPIANSQTVIVLPKTKRGKPLALYTVQSNVLLSNTVLASTSTAELEQYAWFIKNRGFIITALFGLFIVLLIIAVNLPARTKRAT